MSKRTWPIVVLLASGGAFALVEACNTTGPDADARQNGCIGSACFDGSVLEGGPVADADSSTSDGQVGPVDPLAGTTKTATLIKGGYNFTEGPVWVGTKLLFSDVGVSAIFQLNADQTITPFRPVGATGGGNGNAIDAQGRLITCEGNRSRLTRTDNMLGNPKTIAFDFPAGSGKLFNSPNDVIARSDGNIYFTDPLYGAPPDGGAQPRMAVYRINPAGVTTQLSFDFTKPNGIALSPDGNTLYVVDNGDGRVLSAELNANGTVKGTGAFAKVVDADGGDGMAVDKDGNLYVASKAGILVFDKTGKDLGTITLAPGTPSNCTFGGADMKTLYITSNNGSSDAATGLYSIKLNVPGLP